MTKRENFPQKKFQEVETANELMKTDLSNITEQEFRIIVIKLIAGLENSIKDSRESCYRDQGTKEQPGRAKKCYQRAAK